MSRRRSNVGRLGPPDPVLVATRIADKDRIWWPKPSGIGTAGTHDKNKNISEKLAFSKYLKELDFETIKMLEREKKSGKI